MKLASYNIRKAVGLDRRRDPGRVIDVVNGIEADVVVLQEADRRLGMRPTALPFHLIAEHTDFTFAMLATNRVSLGWHGNAILVRKGIEVSEVTRIDLPGLEPRGAVSAVIGGRLRVVGVHLGLMRRHRHGQLRQIRRALDHCSLPTAVLGDFNEWSPHAGLEEFQDDYVMHAPGHSFHAARPVAALDRIGLTHDIGFQGAGVVETQLSRVASDHLPVWADIDLPPAPAELTCKPDERLSQHASPRALSAALAG
ncbi:endonuclease/exonuclease/phosphatase family protein [Maritimibacter fusiformis]|uniref:Metal-dependent hydrolase n=1 Tax=Maritimibacter fusiformis TaxID=2603819 RepID=A0A5D0RMK5_9RHOB|nr:endonuclease/exonuclease/phosphatase family protein [Maritimibacter fusiformis]TYB82752.1 metal-dependent hydrolase [Maritimibacter fusiformis]